MAVTAMTWSDVRASQYLKNLPFKIELNKWGNVEMTPISNHRGMVKAAVSFEVDRRAGGTTLLGCSIATTDGVRVADVAWISDARRAAFGKVTPYPAAPEICVEVKSPSNSWAEMEMKAALYLEAGAEEVWIAGLDCSRRVIRP